MVSLKVFEKTFEGFCEGNHTQISYCLCTLHTWRPHEKFASKYVPRYTPSRFSFFENFGLDEERTKATEKTVSNQNVVWKRCQVSVE